MRIPTIRRTRRLLAPLSLLIALGCSGDDAELEPGGVPDPSTKVSVGGVVTIQGKPIPLVTVTFLPEQGSPGVGETDEAGKYSLQSYGTPGLVPGEYKVAISYLVSAEGEPQDQSARGAVSLPPGMMTATERIPKEYSDLGRSTLKAIVDAEHTSFDFDVKVPLISGPEGGDSAKQAETVKAPASELPTAKEDAKAEGTPSGEAKP